MKKITISLFSLIFVIGVTSAMACGTCGCQNKKEIKKEVKSCDKNKKSCCSSKNSKSSCDKNSKSCCSSKKSKKGNRYSKKNKYSNKKTSCNKSEESCCSKKTTKDSNSKKDNSLEEKDTE